MATYKMIYIKSKALNYYGLAGFHYEYNKLLSRSGDAMIDGDNIHTSFATFKFKNSCKNELITKQEFQEAKGDYSCGDVEFLSEPSNETYTDADGFDAKLDRIPFEIAAVLILFLMVVLLCAN